MTSRPTYARAARCTPDPKLIRATPVPANSASDGVPGRYMTFTGAGIRATNVRIAARSANRIGYTQSAPASAYRRPRRTASPGRWPTTSGVPGA